jgi:hypothetical protein
MTYRHSLSLMLPNRMESLLAACPLTTIVVSTYDSRRRLWRTAWMRRSRELTSIRFPNRVSYGDRLTCCDVSCLPRCHSRFVSNSCHFSEPIRTTPKSPTEVLGRRAGAFEQFRHVTAGTKRPGRITPPAVDGIFGQHSGRSPNIHERCRSTCYLTSARTLVTIN